MKVKELELNNFRGFEKLQIKFPDNNLAVFIGTNGSGKSSVLDALAMFFTELVFQIFDKSLPSTKSPESFLNTAKEAPYPFKLSKNDIRLGLKGFTLNWLTLCLKGTNANWSIAQSKNNQWIGDNTELLKLIKGINLNRNSSLPILVFYQTNRIILSVEDQNNRSQHNGIAFPQLYAYKNALSFNLSQFNDFIGWFKEIEDRENREKIKRKDFSYNDQNLKTIRIALSQFLDSLTSDRYINLRIENPESSQIFDFEFINTDYVLAINKNGQDFDINQLSDGEQTLIMLVCDITRRLTIANPSLENKLEGEGIVMIDEIELHLHPQWQRNVLPALQATFPNIQFIVTTHSPQVLNNVDSKNIFLLHNKDNTITCGQPEATLGRDVNWILEEVMGVSSRPQSFDPVWSKVQHLISQGGRENLTEAKKQIEQLIQEFELTDDGELNAKLAIIKRKEILNQ